MQCIALWENANVLHASNEFHFFMLFPLENMWIIRVYFHSHIEISSMIIFSGVIKPTIDCMIKFKLALDNKKRFKNFHFFLLNSSLYEKSFSRLKKLEIEKSVDQI